MVKSVSEMLISMNTPTWDYMADDQMKVSLCALANQETCFPLRMDDISSELWLPVLPVSFFVYMFYTFSSLS
jgi:hypothetical protein